MKRLFALSLAAAVCAAPLRATLNPAIVPADANWVIHADFDALRSSVVGRELVAALQRTQFTEGNNPVRLNFEKAFAMVHAATAYGANFSDDAAEIDGVLVLEGTPDLRKIAESLLLQAMIANPEEFSEIKDLPFPAYSMQAKTHRPNGAAEEEREPDRVLVAFPPEPIVLLSKSRAQLLRAREAFHGKVPSLATTKGAPLSNLTKTADGAFVFATSLVPTERVFQADTAPARLVKLTRSGALAIGEDGPRTFLRAQFVASDSAAADKTMKILQGITAMLSLKETTDQHLADFLNSASVTREGDVVHLRFAYASDRLGKMVQSLVAHGAPGERTAEQRATDRTAELFNGDALAHWTAEASTAAPTEGPTPVVWRTIDNVTLKNGSIVSLARHRRGGRPVRFERVEIIPANGGTPLTFETRYMTRGGPREAFTLFQFPGADGTYTLKIAYTNDPVGKAEYGVSVKHPKPKPAEAADHE